MCTRPAPRSPHAHDHLHISRTTRNLHREHLAPTILSSPIQTSRRTHSAPPHRTHRNLSVHHSFVEDRPWRGREVANRATMAVEGKSTRHSSAAYGVSASGPMPRLTPRRTALRRTALRRTARRWPQLLKLTTVLLHDRHRVTPRTAPPSPHPPRQVLTTTHPPTHDSGSARVYWRLSRCRRPMRTLTNTCMVWGQHARGSSHSRGRFGPSLLPPPTYTTFAALGRVGQGPPSRVPWRRERVHQRIE